MRYWVLVCVLGLAGIGLAHAASLPDTGQSDCYNDTAADVVGPSDVNSIARDVGSHPRQDCRYGPDAAAAAGTFGKTGAGAKGLDYTKIANNGSTLPAGAALGPNPADWACTRDNLTGLTWEVKTTSGVRDGYSIYWYNSDANTNGGDPGNLGTDTCNGTLPDGHCNTQAYVAAVNAATLCGASDWRVPRLRELLTLFLARASSPSLDTTYFPDNIGGITWTSSTTAKDPSRAWVVWFVKGTSTTFEKATAYMPVRLVRGGPF